MTSLDFRKLLMEAKQSKQAKPLLSNSRPVGSSTASDYSELEEGLDDDIDDLQLEDNSQVVLFDTHIDGVKNSLYKSIVGDIPALFYVPNYFAVSAERSLLNQVLYLILIQVLL